VIDQMRRALAHTPATAGHTARPLQGNGTRRSA
jgi:hypothetical protein